MEAVRAYAKEHGVTDLEDLVCNRLHQHKLRGAWAQIALKLPTRTVRACFNHALSALNHSKTTGTWSPAEEQELLNLVAANGRRWSMIGERMSRLPFNVRKKYDKMRVLRDTAATRRQPWTDAEDEQLIASVKEHHNDAAVIRGERAVPLFMIQWTEIRRQMGLKRPENMYRRRWVDTLYKRVSGLTFSAAEDLRLALAIEALDPQDTQDLAHRWSSLGLHHPAALLKRRWQALCRSVPKGFLLSLPELIGHVVKQAGLVAKQDEDSLKNKDKAHAKVAQFSKHTFIAPISKTKRRKHKTESAQITSTPAPVAKKTRRRKLTQTQEPCVHGTK